MEITDQDIWNEIDKYLTILPPLEDGDITKEMIMQRNGVSDRQAHKTMIQIAEENPGIIHIQVRSGRGQRPWVLRKK